MLHHVRMLVRAGFLIPAPVRTGESGALEKPYRASGATWWLSDPLAGSGPDVALAPIRQFFDEFAAAGPDDMATQATFTLHLSEEDVAELDRQVLAVLDRWVTTDGDRRDRPVHRGLMAVLRMRPLPPSQS